MNLCKIAVACHVLALGSAAWADKDDCKISLPESAPTSLPEGVNPEGWFGSDELAARLPADGHWMGMGESRNFFDKFWWWREGYSAHAENEPFLTVTGVRLDGTASVHRTNATNAFGGNWDLMLIGMEFPVGGCWRVVGRYDGKELEFVLWVGEKLDSDSKQRRGAASDNEN